LSVGIGDTTNANVRGSDVDQRGSGTISRGDELAEAALEARAGKRYTCFVPTVLREGPYRLFFYSGDRNEPPHIHVERDTHRAKFWLDPVRLARSGGFGAAELRELERLVLEHAQLLLGKWNEYFIVTD
jgi:hypothetical protein